MKYAVPYARAGSRVGLLGGSFDPAHAGHRAITLAALKRFDLDQVWWLISPGNPLKPNPPAPMAKRLERARHIMQHPRVRITDLECHLQTRYSAETIAALQNTYPAVRFTWLMGADNLTQFHQWRDWREIMRRVPVGVLARPGQRMAARCSVAAKCFEFARLSSRQSRLLSRQTAPAWCFLNISMTELSSTELRAKSDWMEVSRGAVGGKF